MTPEKFRALWNLFFFIKSNESDRHKAPSRWSGSWPYSLRSEEHLCSSTFQHFYLNISQRSDSGETNLSVLEVSDILPFEKQFYPFLLLLIPKPYAVTLLYTTMQERKGYNLSLFFWSQKRQTEWPICRPNRVPKTEFWSDWNKVTMSVGFLPFL